MLCPILIQRVNIEPFKLSLKVRSGKNAYRLSGFIDFFIFFVP